MKIKFTIILIAVLSSFPILAQEGLDTLYVDYPADRSMKIEQRHDYTKTLVTKLFLSQAGFDGKYKHADNGRQTVYLNFEQALERIKALDNIALGMPQIVYLVGWQYNGHDSKYPAFFEGNELLKRDCDANANESIRWLAAEAKKYNTAVSFHINMFDCYEDSPLFEDYLEADAIARTKTGHLMASEWGYKIDYVQDWNSGLARKRIDRMCELLPVQEAGTVHIDAFHTAAPVPVENPDGSFSVAFPEVLNPYLGWTREEEIAAQIEIIKYWAGKGVDVTTEGLDGGVDGLKDPHSGYRAMVWHLRPELRLHYPNSMLTGGDCGDEMEKRVFGSSDSLESTLRETPCDYSKVIHMLCTTSFINNYLSRFERKFCVLGNDYGKMVYEGGLETEADYEHYTVRENGVLLAEDDDVFIPALWVEGSNMIAYSARGYKGRTWKLLPMYPAKGRVTVWSVDENGRKLVGRRPYSGGKLRLDVKKGQMLLLSFDR